MLADALYGADAKVRRMLEDRRQAYVLATRSNHTLRFLEDDGLIPACSRSAAKVGPAMPDLRADGPTDRDIQTDPATSAEDLDADAWSPLSAGEGAKGPRLYEWARLPIGFSKNNGFERWLLFRRSLRDPKALAYYFVHAPKGTSLPDIAGAAGLRWTIEECFLRAKDDLGLDHCPHDPWEARSWHRWHRHMTLVPMG